MLLQEKEPQLCTVKECLQNRDLFLSDGLLFPNTNGKNLVQVWPQCMLRLLEKYSGMSPDIGYKIGTHFSLCVHKITKVVIEQGWDIMKNKLEMNFKNLSLYEQ
jgi:hypothetical protein